MVLVFGGGVGQNRFPKPKMSLHLGRGLFWISICGRRSWKLKLLQYCFISKLELGVGV